jgi:hypothetical protein
VCETCNNHKLALVPETLLPIRTCVEILRGQFADLALFDEFSSLPYPTISWGLEMIGHAVEFSSDLSRSDPYIVRRFVNSNAPQVKWVARTFPQFGSAQLITKHWEESPAIVMDFAFPDTGAVRNRLESFEQCYLPHLQRVA